MENLKTIVIFILTGVLIWFIGKNNDYYGCLMQVVGFDFTEDTVIFQDYSGECYEWYGIEDWYMHDFAVVCLDDNGTDFCEDDKIVSVRYTRTDFDNYRARGISNTVSLKWW